MAKPRPGLAATVNANAAPPFAEAPAWAAVGAGWRQLFGSFKELGFSFEWHDFVSKSDLDWARSFHPGGVELCLNLSGGGELGDGRERVVLGSRMLTFYHQGEPPLQARRQANDIHQFITVEFAPEYLTKHFAAVAGHLHPLVRAVVAGAAAPSGLAGAERLTVAHTQMIESLRRPPVFAPAQRVWFESKALELAAQFFFQPAAAELFCTRQQRVSRDRVQRAQNILRQRLTGTPSLEELGKEVGCSPFYLSRLFSQEAGMTIQQYIRQLRMERAAELLRTGQCNVTEAAFEVGYNSLSAFSTAFHQTFGCCPGLYPMQLPWNKKA